VILIEYLRVLVAGVCARVWRVLRGAGCPCPFCVAHAASAREGVGVLVPEPVVDEQGDVYAAAPGPSRAYLPTLDEVRDRRGV
jgi:hypothetical protein